MVQDSFSVWYAPFDSISLDELWLGKKVTVLDELSLAGKKSYSFR
jgi:hypothetical protein